MARFLSSGTSKESALKKKSEKRERKKTTVFEFVIVFLSLYSKNLPPIRNTLARPNLFTEGIGVNLKPESILLQTNTAK